MRAEPRAAGGPEAPQWSIDRRCLSPEIGVVMTDPTTRAVLNTRRARAVLDQFRNHPQQRLVTLRKISRLGRPVVHLGVDIDGVLAFPRRRHQVVPDALQVGGLRSEARRRDQQVTAVLKIQRGELRIETLQKLRWTFICW